LLKLQEHGIQSALIDGKQITTDLLDAPRDPITVKRPQDIKSLEDHKRQSALQDVCFLFHRSVVLVSNRKDGTLPLGKQQVGGMGWLKSRGWGEAG
jgi:hypothetical protein